MAQERIYKWVCKHCQNVNLSSEAEGEVFYCDACQEARTDEALTDCPNQYDAPWQRKPAPQPPKPPRKEPQQGKGYGKLIAGLAALILCGGFFLMHNGGGSKDSSVKVATQTQVQQDAKSNSKKATQEKADSEQEATQDTTKEESSPKEEEAKVEEKKESSAAKVAQKPQAEKAQTTQAAPAATVDYYAKGKEYLANGDYTNAISAFEQAAAANNNLLSDGSFVAAYAEAYNERGNQRLEAGNSGGAIQDYSAAIRLAPSADAYYNRGGAYLQAQRYSEAISDYTQAINYAGASATSYYNRGICYHNLGRYNEALADYESALRLSPNDATIRQTCTDLKKVLGKK